jgi:hypothetical protein
VSIDGANLRIACGKTLRQAKAKVEEKLNGLGMFVASLNLIVNSQQI